MRFLYYSALTLISVGLLGAIAAVVILIWGFQHYGHDIPDYSQLKDYKPPVVTRLHAGDGRLIAEYAKEKRVFVPIEAIPPLVKNAFISAEDKNFYHHNGLDYFGIMRAILTNVKNFGSGKRPVGASTITQQVAKNFLLTNEVSIERKIKEAILAFRMEHALSKDRLLELYLNEIYLGMGSYGAAAAALNYFDKSLDELEIHEAAYIAALPKAPNNYHPVRNHDDALERRNWVINRMVDDGHIHESQGDLAKQKPLAMADRSETEILNANYFAEEVRRELLEKYGEDGLYHSGLSVRTTIDPFLQDIAVRALRAGLTRYDRRHGYRGPVAKIKNMGNWKKDLAKIEPPKGTLRSWHLAVVHRVSQSSAEIYLPGGTSGTIPLEELKWARKPMKDGYIGPAIDSARAVLSRGDVILVEDLPGKKQKGRYALRQIPEIQGAAIAIDPHTGRILAMQGGWSYEISEYNRVTQADRQPGSAFKPFVYLAALDKGFTPATLVLDAPFVKDQGPGLGKWRPSNYSKEYYGPTPIRIGIEKSRNLMTVRLADYVGMKDIAKYATDFDIVDTMPPYLAMALGAQETTLMRLTSAYAILVNGGKQVIPTVIDRIQNRRGETIFNHDTRPCDNCGDLVRWENQDTPEIPDTRRQMADPRHAYQIASMMEGVVKRGTARRLNALGRPLAGKTGTTNESKDTWFIGFSPDLVVGVFMGFDEPRTLGKRETGSSVSAPVFKDFMEEALADKPAIPFRVPPGIRHVQINAEDGTRAKSGDKRVIWEAFVSGTEPTDDVYILDGNGISLMPTISGAPASTKSVTTGTGGLY